MTALAIARDLGLAGRPDEVVSGADLAEMDETATVSALSRARVFARVAPAQKLRLVRAAQKAGHFVAVTGDGVNDAPAPRAADIGIAMGRSGTDVAREASELVISDDNFASIVGGIEEGRVAYDNIRKVVYLLISTGAAEVLLVLATLLLGLPLPLLPTQILWLNLVTNGIQGVALAFEPSEGDVMRRLPRTPREPMFNSLMVQRTVLAGAVMAGVSTAAFAWFHGAGWSDDAARNAVLLLMVLFELVHIGNCRSETASAFSLSPLRNPLLLFGTAGAFGIHLVAMYLPVLQSVLQTAPVSLAEWAMLLLLSLTVLVAMEVDKRLRRRS